MRLSQLLGKRIINIYDGEILGLVGDADLLVNEVSGEICGLLIPRRGGSGFGDKRCRMGESRLLHIPWDRVCKVGTEVIVVDFDCQ